jgi:hypothetical protein
MKHKNGEREDGGGGKRKGGELVGHSSQTFLKLKNVFL